MTSQLVGADFTDGALLPNYVNGRLLVAEDLATGQASLRTRDTRAGEAAGAGIVRGLWVTGSGTTVTVAAGLALSPAGEPVVVARPTTLQLGFASAGTTSDRTSFSCCGSGIAGGTDSTLGQGILLLTARAACKLDGAAPMAPSPGSDVSPCCAAQWLVAGVEFRAIALPVGPTVDEVTLNSDNSRNLVAHWVYGTERLVKLGQDPFSFDPAFTGLDQLDPADLTAYDVPLAVFRWDGTGVADLDNWSARRRITEPDPATVSWSATTSTRRVADGQARVLQVQDQVEELVARGVARTLRAEQAFGLLPPVGFLPVVNSHLVAVSETSMKRYRLMAAQEQKPMTKAQVEAKVAETWAARLPEEMRSTSAENQPVAGTERMLLSHSGTGTIQDKAFTSSAAQLEAGVVYFERLYQIGSSTIGYGFDPRTFFGDLARFGGVLDWQMAEWALHQSWRAFPVPVPSTLIFEKAATAADPASDSAADTGVDPAEAMLLLRANRPSHQVSQWGVPPITYYYVMDNIESAEGAVDAQRAEARSYVRAPRHTFITSDLYVVFIANRRWEQGTLPPFMDGTYGWSGSATSGTFTSGLPDET